MTTELARRYKVDVSTDGTNWTPLKGINDFQPEVTSTKQDDSDYDSNGWASQVKTMQAWVATVKLNRKSTSGVFDPGQEILRAAHDQFGDAGCVYMRWYDRQGRADAYSGFGFVDWSRSKTSVPDLDEATAVVTGIGARTAISNPYAAGVAPVIVSATPSGAATGAQVTITGSGFTGTVPTSGVKFGATNATSWVVLSDSVIVAIVPTGSAGAANIVVTNATGASTAFSYTRG